MLGIRRGEFVDIIRTSLPVDPFTDVEKRVIISPYNHQLLIDKNTYSLIDIRLIRSL